jgi:hypothetical protein
MNSGITVRNERVPAGKLVAFQEILRFTGGYFLANPRPLNADTYLVDYEPGNYRAQTEAWNRCMTPIREVRKDQRWRRLLRRIGINV